LTKLEKQNIIDLSLYRTIRYIYLLNSQVFSREKKQWVINFQIKQNNENFQRNKIYMNIFCSRKRTYREKVFLLKHDKYMLC